MNQDIKKVFIVGATGFLGYHSSLELLSQGIKVGTSTRGKEDECLPKDVIIERKNLDIFKATQEEISEIFKGYDAMVYSVGPDDRILPPAPAYDFFHEKLVIQCTKVVKAAKQAGIKKVTIMNSYFAYFDREFNGLLSQNHPYIKARVEQAKACIELGEEGVMDVMILELPYIFGNMPGKIPLWKDVFLDNFEKMKTIYFPKGGTVTVHVKDVARAVVGSTLNGKHGGKYPIGITNMKFKEMIEYMYKCIGKERKVVNIPTFLGYLNGLSMQKKAKKEGKEPGLNYAKLMPDILAKDLYYTEETIKKVEQELGFKYTSDVKDGIDDAMKACYPSENFHI